MQFSRRLDGIQKICYNKGNTAAFVRYCLKPTGGVITDKTLYISDLDGTLLQSDQRISKESCEILNGLTERGLIFSYATARSMSTSEKAVSGLEVGHPVILYNGAFIMSQNGERLLSNTFTADESERIYCILRTQRINPTVYSIIDGKEKFSYIPQNITQGMKTFLDTRKGDVRDNPIANETFLLNGEVFYFLCVDSIDRLEAAFAALSTDFACVYSRDLYSGDMWLEIMPKAATKANAARKLKELLACDRLVVFGDGVNDIPLFRTADECYAVENAAPELKALASGVIGSNDSGSVARFILGHFNRNFTV